MMCVCVYVCHLFNFSWYAHISLCSWLGVCVCICVRACVRGYVRACRSPAPLLSICMCRVLRDVGSALPRRHLNFSPRCVLHYTRLHCVKSVRLHPLQLSVLSLFIYLPRPHALPPQLPPTPRHTHTHTCLIKARSSLD